ncbi:MAG: hypothetical protein AAGF53_13940 [Pseudomonadota bacterium]
MRALQHRFTMLHFIRLFLASFLMATPALAEDLPQIYTQITKDHVWDAVEAQDFKAAEKLFAASYKHVRQNRKDHDHTRWLYEVFVTSSPHIAKFAEEWVELYPESAFAHNALTWVYYTTGFDVRGEKYASLNYPGALDAFGNFHSKALEHAMRAYELKPNLLPASDGIIRLAMTTGNKFLARAVIHKAMHEDPNTGTLYRAVDMTLPGWGGTWEEAKRFCTLHGPKIRMLESKQTVGQCVLYAAGELHGREQEIFEWYKAEAAKREFPELDSLYASRISTAYATAEEAAFLHEYLTRPDVTDYELAYMFDSDIALKFGYEFLYEAHIRRARELAQETIERDPYHTESLKILMKDISGFSVTETGTYRISVLERVPREEVEEYKRRLLQTSPYNPDYWADLARLKSQASGPRGVLDDEPYLINAIVYGNHRESTLASYIISRWSVLSQLERLEWEMQTPRWQEQTPDQIAESTKIIEEWIAHRETMDLDEQLRCPIMRAYRLFKMVTFERDEGSGPLSDQYRDMAEIILADVNKRRVCTGIMAVPEHELLYEPIAVDLNN